jgi:hypothetical protein
MEYVPGTTVSLQNGAPWQRANYHPHLHQSSKRNKNCPTQKLSWTAKKKKANKQTNKQTNNNICL